jgi:carboxypeptidase Q
MNRLILAALVASTLPSYALSQEAPKSVAYDIVKDLTTEIGQRHGGTEAEARARDWAVVRLKKLGFSNVRIEEFDMPVWVRGEERGSITTPFPFKLALTALGNSGATPTAGLKGSVIVYPTYDAFKAAPDADVKGKIVYVSHAMHRTMDGSSYGAFGVLRRQGPNIAAKRGAAAFLIRSIGTSEHRTPHTGNTSWEAGVTPIPAAALSNPDADQVERIVAASGGKPVTIDLTLTPRFVGKQKSGNVVAEIPGTDPAAGLVVLGGHIDSWDLGTGALDDAAGVAITTAAAKRILDSGKKPKRTIRVVWWGAEEVGIFGGGAYFEAHKSEAHAFASESDFGAGRIWRFDVRLPEMAQPLADRLAIALAPLGITKGKEVASGGADVGQLIGAGVPAIDLQQDGTHYFDYHHTADDTLDKIDPEALQQNVDAWTIMINLVANAPEDLMSGQKK